MMLFPTVPYSLVSTQSDIWDEQYRTGPDIRTSDIRLKRDTLLCQILDYIFLLVSNI